ncbi:MAG: type II CAAX endopeptidase family protein [Anaerolineaceae bacterium]
MLNPFYNKSEHRVRALWRILIQAVVFFVGQILLSVVIGLIAAVAVLLSGQYAQEVLSTPGMFINIYAQVIYSSPVLWFITPLINLASMLLSVWFAAKVLDHRPFKDFGFHFNRQWWKDMVFGLALGALLMILIFAVELASGWVTVTGYLQNLYNGIGFWLGMAQSLLLYICVGIYEEMLSRGYELRNLAEGLNFKRLGGARGGLLLAYALSSIVFGMLHLGNANTTWVSTLNLVIAGLLMGLGFILTGNLAIPIGLHITWNFFQGNVFGFPVSGTAKGASFIGIQQGGPDLFTGGAFGPEAGLVGVAAMLIGAGLIFWYVRSSRGKLELCDRLAVYTLPQQPSVEPPEEPVEGEENLPEDTQSGTND